jgi:hypothetical protein
VKKLLLVPVLVLSLGMLLQLTSNAEEKTVNATITPLVVSISVSPDTVTYGTRSAGVGEVSSTPEKIAVTNTGTVTQNLQIKGANSTSNDWTLALSAGTDQFVHRFSTNNSSYTDMTTDYKNLQMGVISGGAIDLYLRLVVPTVITKTAVQTLPVKILGTQAN